MLQNFAVVDMEEQMTTARKFSIIIICATMVIALIYCVNVSTTMTKMSAVCLQGQLPQTLHP